jgi:protein-disulfide isomerase
LQKKTLVTVLAVAGGAIVLVLALVIGSSLSGKSKSSPDTSSLQRTTSINEMLRGIQQHGTVLGNPKAKVTLTEFGDPQCTACAYYSSNGLPNLIQDYVRSGKLRIEYQGQTFVDQYTKDSTDSIRLLRMALAAGQQGKLWNFVELVYANQGAENSGYATDSYLKSVASAIPGLDVDKAFAAASAAGAFDSEIKASAKRFKAASFGATPSFLLGLTGAKTQEKVGEGDLAARIAALLKS